MTIVLHHAPKTRSFSMLWMLEELGEPYELNVLDLSKGEHRTPEHLALNPLGKVPAISDGEVHLAERPAICTYLADRYSLGTLAPALEDPRRGRYLQWMVYSTAVLEPAFCEKFFDWKGPDASIGWGSLERAVSGVRAAVDHDHFLLGEAFTAVDVMMGATLHFGVQFGALDKGDAIEAYVKRCTERPAFARAREREAALAS